MLQGYVGGHPPAVEEEAEVALHDPRADGDPVHDDLPRVARRDMEDDGGAERRDDENADLAPLSSFASP